MPLSQSTRYTKAAAIMSERVPWPIEGSLHPDVRPTAIYVDERIRTFLEADRLSFLIASKGMGKTLLLRSKKYHLNQYRSEGQLLIPRDSEYDEPALGAGLPVSYKGLSDEELWSDLWRISIILSILSHGIAHLGPVEEVGTLGHVDRPGTTQSDVRRLLDDLQIESSSARGWLDDISHESSRCPSFYLAQILQMGVRYIEALRKKMYVFSTLSTRYIRRAVCIFIDAFDHCLTAAFGARNPEAWKSGQIGLLLAGHCIGDENHHVKLYASIRQEAFSGYFGQHKEVIRGKSLELRYGPDNLERMFEENVRMYSTRTSLREFLGVNLIQNGAYKMDEQSPFMYIYRHTVGTPRSLAAIGRELQHEAPWSVADPKLRNNKITKTVNTIAAKYVKEDYLYGQQMQFLETLCTSPRIEQLLRLIPSNVLNLRSLQSINRRFSSLIGIPYETSHPFCELFNIGLLGHPRRDSSLNHERVQYFKRPHEFSWRSHGLLNEQRPYFLHPSLHEACDQENDDYYLHPAHLIGDGYSWKAVNTFPSVFVSYSSADRDAVESLLSRLDDELPLRAPHDVWYDRESLKAGDDWQWEISREVEDSDAVLLLLSRASLASNWVRKEWEAAHDRQVRSGRNLLVLVNLDGTPIDSWPLFLRTYMAERYVSGTQQGEQQFVVRLSEAIARILRDSLDSRWA